MNLNQPIENLKIRSDYLQKIKKLGIKTIRDFFYYFPYRYDDFSIIKPIASLKIDETATIRGKVSEIKNIRTFKKKLIITEAIIKDQTNSIKAIWFNQPFLVKNIKTGDFINISGKLTASPKNIYISNPAYEIIRQSADSPKHTAGLIPVYPETAGITSRAIRYLIKTPLFSPRQTPDFLPKEILKKYSLMDLSSALRQIHFPDSFEKAEAAKKRLAFEELFLMQMMFINRKKNLSENAPTISTNIELIKKFIGSLKFTLTDSQKIAIWEILKDISKNKPMNRLLNGDVGSGKTVVAAAASLTVASRGFQIALMAPTEILARQHFETFSKILKKFKIPIGILTGSESKIYNLNNFNSDKIKKDEFLKLAKNGDLKIICGTHALIQDKINFKNLALAIIDEQHRFGVSQRAALTKKNSNRLIPHLLSVTATPIPRTLALSIYGDLDISIINEMPKGRKKIITKIVPSSEKESSYNFIRKKINEGRQAFIICPKIEIASDKEKTETKKRWNEVKAVKEEHKKLSEKIFPEFKIAMVHGKLKAKEKEEIMRKFANGETNILVSTSVIEVGVDIPNATTMIIENSERFGLAQLHQFRGRVGRSEYQSYCFLFTDPSLSKISLERLIYLEKSENGFELAEKDLKLRGPGDFLGARQWGLPSLAIANLGNAAMVKSAKEEASRIIAKDKNLENFPLLKEKIYEFKKEIHLE